MRNVLIILCLLTVLLVFASESEMSGFLGPKNTAVQMDYDPWRRTNAGWEMNTNWVVKERPRATRVHPMILASFQVLACMGTLLACKQSDLT